MTLHESLDAAVRVLVTSGMPADEARRDGSVLIRHCLGWSTAEWIARNREAADATLHDRLITLAQRRARREPVAYLTGVREFYGRDFHVTPATLIPRPETEGLVDAVMEDMASERVKRAQPVLFDIGTGSGCIAITLALEWPGARVIATDISSEALEVARGNARRLGADQIQFVEATLLPPDAPAPHVIVSNPPYVPERDRASLAADVRDFEPASAVFAGDDGLAVIRPLIAAAASRLQPGGWLILEIGAGQADVVSGLIRERGMIARHVRSDLQGIPRIVSAQRPAAS